MKALVLELPVLTLCVHGMGKLPCVNAIIKGFLDKGIYRLEIIDTSFHILSKSRSNHIISCDLEPYRACHTIEPFFYCSGCSKF